MPWFSMFRSGLAAPTAIALLRPGGAGGAVLAGRIKPALRGIDPRLLRGLSTAGRVERPESVHASMTASARSSASCSCRMRRQSVTGNTAAAAAGAMAECA